MKKICFLTLLACLFRPGPAVSAEATFDVSYYYYEERNFMNDESDPAFISLGVRRWDAFFETLTFLYTAEVTAGKVRYSGSGNLDKDYYKFRGEIYGGARFGKLTPFAGLGYRWLYDDSGGQVSTTGAYSYDRRSQYFYIPIGLIVDPNKNFTVKSQFNIFVAGKQTSYLSDIAGYSDVDNDQSSGWGVDIAASYKFSGNFGIYSFLRYWDIADSDTAVGTFNNALLFSAYEPANTTVEIGVGISYRF